LPNKKLKLTIQGDSRVAIKDDAMPRMIDLIDEKSEFITQKGALILTLKPSR